VNPHFLEFLLSLGWEVQVAGHCGWTGYVNSSWKHGVADDQSKFHLVHKGMRSGKSPPELKKKTSNTSNAMLTTDNVSNNETHGGSLYNGDERILYWADVSSEIAFVVPTGRLMGPGNDATVWNTTNQTSQVIKGECKVSAHLYYCLFL